mmetsp:Transcript_558/g.1139  ORF Transcript_558/g.1139 Transcript_558/m.1139 type:complete len:430 (+) Transcript_558:351-1640(+)
MELAVRLEPLGDEVEHSLDQVGATLDNSFLHRGSVRHRRVVHAQAVDGRVEEIEAPLRNHSRDGRAHAARHGGLVEDRHLVRLRDRRAESVHVEGLERSKLDQVDVHPLRLDLRHHHHGLLDAMQVREHCDGFPRLDRCLRRRVKHLALVQRQARAHVDEALGLFHRLHGSEEDPRPVVADHRLRQTVRRLWRGGSADLQPGDAHHVRVQRLRVLGAEGLVGRRATRPDDRHRHDELAAGGGIRVARRGHLGDAVDAEVGVHQLHDRTVAIHALAERLADEVALIDDLVGGAKAAEGLLCELWDVVRRARLQVLRVDGRLRVAQHLLENGQVERVSNRESARLASLLLQLLQMLREHRQLLGADGTTEDRLAVDGARHHGGRVVVRVRGVGELQLLRKLGWRRFRSLSELHCLLHHPLCPAGGTAQVES